MSEMVWAVPTKQSRCPTAPICRTKLCAWHQQTVHHESNQRLCGRAFWHRNSTCSLPHGDLKKYGIEVMDVVNMLIHLDVPMKSV